MLVQSLRLNETNKRLMKRFINYQKKTKYKFRLFYSAVKPESDLHDLYIEN